MDARLSQRLSQQAWSRTTIRERLSILRQVRGILAARPDELTATVRREAAETLVAEVLPLAEACLFLEREAEALLAPRKVEEGRPWWLSGVDLEIHREPLGVVLVVGPANYPLFLPAVHSLQALAAGNAVLVKPGSGGRAAMEMFARLLKAGGLPDGLIHILGEDVSEAQSAIAAGVDKVILTGSHATGQAVLALLAANVTPSVMELSGCDAVFVREDADLNLAVRAVRFGLGLNSGETCIAPRKIYVSHILEQAFRAKTPGMSLPIHAFSNEEEAVADAASCGYALGASVFGKEPGARRLAARIRAGVVVINDMIVPTADPRLPFGGRGKSGFGITRGPEGLLEMTVIKAITVRSGRWRPHLDAAHPTDGDLFRGFLAMRHGDSLRSRWAGFLQLSRAAMARKSLKRENDQ